MTESQFIEGLVVAPRKWKPVENRGRKTGKGARTGWTRHREDCPHLARKHPSDLMPAPRREYPDTVDCPLCKPGDPHHAKWKDTGAGTVEAWCIACDLTATAGNSNAALSSLGRQHRIQRDRETFAAAIAADGAPARVITRRNGGIDLWTLHRPDCLYVGRARSLLPAPDPVTDNIQPCVYCRPNDTQFHHTTYLDVDGVVLATCDGCELTATGATTKSAWAALKRRHDSVADRAALEAAVVAGERPSLLVTRRHHATAVDASKWTLHRAGCWQVGRARGARPAPNPLEPNTTACTYCRPDQEASQAVA